MIQIMSCRYLWLEQILLGLKTTHLPLISYDLNLQPTIVSDDMGIYYFIPKVMNLLNVNLQSAIDIFFISIMVLSSIFGLIGFFNIYKKLSQRILVLMFLLINLLISFKIHDIYIMGPSLTMAVVPWIIYFERSKRKLNILFFLILGILFGTAHFIRAYSEISILFFLFFYTVLNTNYKLRNKLIYFLILILGFTIPVIFFEVQMNNRDNYLTQNHTGAQKPIRQHLIWHSMYIGLGFLNNEYKISYNDKIAFNRAKSISPEVEIHSKQYETIIKGQIINILKNNPVFVIYNIFAKIGIFVACFILVANVGILAAFNYRKPLAIDISLFFSLLSSSVFGVLVIPYLNYLADFITFCLIFSLFSINYAINCGFKRRSKT